MRVGSGARSGFLRGSVMVVAVLAGSAGKGRAAQMPPDPVVSPTSVPSTLELQIQEIVSAPAVARAHWGVAVAAMDGTPLLEIHAGQLFQPASTAKLFTTAAAMSLLGPARTVSTRVVARGVFASRTELRGDLVLIGAADANLSGRAIPYVAPRPTPTPQPGDETASAAPDPLRSLAALADEIAASGLKVVTGDVLGDDMIFPWEPYAPGWELDDLVWGYGAPVDALSVGDNELRLTVTPGMRAGAPAAVELAQAVPYYIVETTATTATAGSKAGGIQVERAPGSRVLRVYGQIAVDANADVNKVALADPAEYAAMALKAMLATRGVEVRGQALPQHRLSTEARGFLAQVHEPHGFAPAEQPGSLEEASACDTASSNVPHRSKLPGAPPGCPPDKLLAQHTSPTLAEDVVITNKTSENLHAELLLHRLGRAFGDDGSTAQGVRVVRQFALGAGISGDDLVLYDGSGLSGHDLMTPHAEVTLLLYATQQPWFAAWKASLPIGGIDGTLQSRFLRDPLKGHVFAKTGTLGEARALAGYLDCASGRTVIFSVMDTNHAPGSSADRDAAERIVAAIAAAN